MNPQDPLSQLHPLRDPEAIGWWPLAPGWWVLLGIIVLVIAIAAYLWWRRYQARAYRRQAEEQLTALLAAFREDQDAAAFFGGVNSLLKATALQAFPRRAVAAASGEQWLALLNESMDQATDPFSEDLVSAAYKADTTAADPESFHRAALTWIRHHKVAA